MAMEVTELLDMQGSYGVVLCRKEFHLDTLDTLTAVVLRILYDDGVVVYANGSEVERLNMPEGPVTAGLLALSAVDPVRATVEIPVELLVEDRNVIAVSVHNWAIDSSGSSFVPLVYEIGPATGVDCGLLFLRGDANADGAMDIADAVYVLNNLFAGGPAPACMQAADANDDNNVDIADPIYLPAEPSLWRWADAERAGGRVRCGPDAGGRTPRTIHRASRIRRVRRNVWDVCRNSETAP